MDKLWFDKYEHFTNIFLRGYHYGWFCNVDNAFPFDEFRQFLNEKCHNILAEKKFNLVQFDVYRIPPAVCSMVCCICETDCISYNCFIYNIQKIFYHFYENTEYRQCIEFLYHRKPFAHTVPTAEDALKLFIHFLKWQKDTKKEEDLNCDFSIDDMFYDKEDDNSVIDESILTNDFIDDNIDDGEN